MLRHLVKPLVCMLLSCFFGLAAAGPFMTDDIVGMEDAQCGLVQALRADCGMFDDAGEMGTQQPLEWNAQAMKALSHFHRPGGHGTRVQFRVWRSPFIATDLLALLLRPPSPSNA